MVSESPYLNRRYLSKAGNELTQPQQASVTDITKRMQPQEAASPQEEAPPPQYFVIEGPPLKTFRRKIGSPSRPAQYVGKICSKVRPEVLTQAFSRMTKPKIRIYEAQIPRRRDQFVLKTAGPLNQQDIDNWVDTLNSLIDEIETARGASPIQPTSALETAQDDRPAPHNSPPGYVNSAFASRRHH